LAQNHQIVLSIPGALGRRAAPRPRGTYRGAVDAGRHAVTAKAAAAAAARAQLAVRLQLVLLNSLLFLFPTTHGHRGLTRLHGGLRSAQCERSQRLSSSVTGSLSPPMKVVQITDIHLFGDESGCMAEWPGRPTLASLSLVLDDVLRTAPDLDALVVSGDVADVGTDDGAYFTLRQELERRGLLALSHVIPGNHDRRAPLLTAFPACQSDPGLADGGDCEVSFAVSVHATDGEWRLVGLDSGGAGAAPTLSMSQLQRLENELGDAHHAGKRTLLFMHHSPVAVGHYFDSPFADTVREPLESILRDSGRRVDALFTGHNHYESESEIVGVPVYVAPSTACQYATNPADERQWMVASAASDHSHLGGIDPQAPVHHLENALMPPGYRIIESDPSSRQLVTHCVWVPEAAKVGVAAEPAASL
jgi:Icc protein